MSIKNLLNILRHSIEQRERQSHAERQLTTIVGFATFPQCCLLFVQSVD